MKRKLKWIIPTAFMLAVIIGALTFFRGGSGEIRARALSKAEYPKMAQYPSEPTGNDGWDEYQKEHDKWWEEQLERRKYYGVAELDGFVTKTVGEFFKDKKENTVYSPTSVYMALSMLAEVTDGNTRAEILSLLGAKDIDSLRTQANALWNANYSDDGHTKCIMGNSIWLNDKITYKKDTLKTLSKQYFASTFYGKMGTKEYNELLRDWLNEQTGGLLKEQIKKEKLDADAVAALASTIYFKAPWKEKFDEKETKKDIFHSQEGDQECDFLNITEEARFLKGKNFSATQKALRHDGNMWFILPDEGVTIDDVLQSSEALSFIAAPNKAEKARFATVNLSVPKFDVSGKFDLIKGLKNLGVSDCFDFTKADFTPLTDLEELEISRADHNARVKIDEDGVEGAAYTVVAIECMSAWDGEDIVFKADRPFIFVVTGNDGAPLFIGTVNEVK